MQLRLEFHHQLRSSRRLVLENIMDIEHVPVLHKRWFREVRVRQQSPGYVEYRLKSYFFGLRQEILARGGPIDNDHYWYEFITPLATARVDGSLEGADGNLTQTEKITFRFPLILAPLFWLLKPLLLKQKQDILECDTKLLERAYGLEQSGFRRHERTAPRIVVYGGSGFFGRLVVEELLKTTPAEIVVASRNPKYVDYIAQQARVKFVESNLADYDSVLRTIDGAAIAVLCGGPFHRMLPSLLRACIEKKIAYIDIADDRSFVERAYMFSADAEVAGIAAFIGCSVVPGLTSLLTQFSRQQVGDVEKVEIAISPGTKHPRGPASFECLLATLGEQIGDTSIRGWSHPRSVEFPEPMGRRILYRIVDIADYFIQPHYFGTKTVEFRIGSELWILNAMLSCVAAIRRRTHVPANFLIGLSRFVIRIATPFGTRQGGVWVRVEGRSDGEQRRVEWAVWANQRGEIIPAIPAAIAARMLLSGEVPKNGIVPPDWISRDELISELLCRGVNVASRRNPEDPWQAVTAQFRLNRELTSSSPEIAR